MGANLRQGASFTQTIIVGKGADYAVVSGAYGNDYEVEVSVKDDRGKNVVIAREKDGVDFSASRPGRYHITARNKGASTFVALAILRESGGPNHPISSINVAVANIADGIKDSFLDGYSAPINQLMVLGVILPPNGAHSWDTGFNFPRWMMIGATETDVRSLNLTITDRRSKKVYKSIKDKKYSYSDFEMVLPSASVGMKNVGKRAILGMQALVR